MAKRKKKSATSMKLVKKKAIARPKKRVSAKKTSPQPKKGAKRGRTGAPVKAASRAGLATLLPPKRPSTTARSHEMRNTADEAVTESDPSIAGIDGVRLINHADQAAGGSCPTQTGEHSPPTHTLQIAEVVAEQEDRLEEVRPLLVDPNEDELLRLALWWAGNPRKPRAAIVGRALHDLESFEEELAFKRGTAAAICQKIKYKNPGHLRASIERAMKSGKTSDVIDSALLGHLKPAWAVLQQLGLLEAAPRAGVYLVGRGLKVFDGFPKWSRPDEPMPDKPTRPPSKPRS